MDKMTDLIVRPRLNDYYGVYLSQAKVDFAIPFPDFITFLRHHVANIENQ